MNILGISGSPRKGGNTDILLKEILRGVRNAGIETTALFLRDYAITPCIGCEKCRNYLTCTQFNDGMSLIYPLIEDAEIIIVGSPVYNYNVTSQMKAFIDRLYPYYEFSDDRPRKYRSYLADKNRKALFFSVAEQTDPQEEGFALEAMSRPLEALGYQTLEKIPFRGFFDKSAVKQDESVLLKAYEIGQTLVNTSGKN